MQYIRPDFLYKYRPINPHSLNIILSNEVYFSSIPDLNDPFDCNVMPKLDVTNWEIQAKRHPKINWSDPMKLMQEQFTISYENIRGNIKIFCLSELNSNVLMFSHYADSHKGICLEFKVSDDPFFEYLERVNYPDDYPLFSAFSGDMNNNGKKLIEIEVLIKSKQWSYEKEWRILTKEQDNVQKYPAELLNSVIFGYRTSTEDKKLIEHIAKARNPQIELKQAIKKDGSFELEIVPYKN